MNFLFIIVIYNKGLCNSQTLQTLINNSKIDNDKKKIIVWNNGPSSVVPEFNQNYENRNCQLIETLDNTPLSVIYNKCINQSLTSDYFIILDDDTTLTDSYFDALHNLKHSDLMLPHIIDAETNKNIAPTDNSKIIINDGEFSLKKPGSVSSGLVLSRRLIDLVKKYYKGTVFDEHFAFYGIDSTFLIRIQKINKKEQIAAVTQGTLIHSLSHNVKESPKKKAFRRTEMSYDIALTLRHYPSFGKFKTFLRDLKKIRKGKSLLTTKDILRCFTTGKHPRCR